MNKFKPRLLVMMAFRHNSFEHPVVLFSHSNASLCSTQFILFLRCHVCCITYLVFSCEVSVACGFRVALLHFLAKASLLIQDMCTSSWLPWIFLELLMELGNRLLEPFRFDAFETYCYVCVLQTSVVRL